MSDLLETPYKDALDKICDDIRDAVCAKENYIGEKIQMLKYVVAISSDENPVSNIEILSNLGIRENVVGLSTAMGIMHRKLQGLIGTYRTKPLGYYLRHEVESAFHEEYGEDLRKEILGMLDNISSKRQTNSQAAYSEINMSAIAAN